MNFSLSEDSMSGVQWEPDIVMTRYKIIDQSYDWEAEKWQFEPGESVACESTELSDRVVRVAVQRQE